MNRFTAKKFIAIAFFTGTMLLITGCKGSFFQGRMFDRGDDITVEDISEASRGIESYSERLDSSSRDIEDVKDAVNTGDEYSGKGKVRRVLTWSDNETTPCMAVIKENDGGEFDAYVRAFDDKSTVKQFAASAVCDALINAFSSQKDVVVAGVVDGVSNGSLTSMDISNVNYYGVLKNGTVSRVLTWVDNNTTLCMAEIGDNSKSYYVRFNNSPDKTVLHSMSKVCNSLITALGSEDVVSIDANEEVGGSMSINSVNIEK